MPQGIVVQFVHQCNQTPELAGWKTFPCEPAQIVSGQIGDKAAFVFPVRHFPGRQED